MATKKEKKKRNVPEEIRRLNRIIDYIETVKGSPLKTQIGKREEAFQKLMKDLGVGYGRKLTEEEIKDFLRGKEEKTFLKQYSNKFKTGRKLTDEEIDKIREEYSEAEGVKQQEKPFYEFMEDALDFKRKAKETIKNKDFYHVHGGLKRDSKAIVYQNLKKSGDSFYDAAKLASKEQGSKKYVLFLINEAYKMYKSASEYISGGKEEPVLRKKLSSLEVIINKSKPKLTTLSLSIASFILALFFSVFNLTGNVIGSVKQDFSILGILFFILGLVFVFVYARSKR